MESGEITKNIKICLAASAGGHLTQLLKLRGVLDGYTMFWITTSEVVCPSLQEYGNVYVLKECNRKMPVRLLGNLARCAVILMKEKPKVVLSTGAATGCIACFLAKLIGAKVIWVDSITNVDRLSLSGRMLIFIADLFLVQWPQLAVKYRHAEYAGVLI